MVADLTVRSLRRWMLAGLAVLALSEAVQAEDGKTLLEQFDSYPHAVQVARVESQVVDHVVPLGALKKVRGVWEFKDSERLSGSLLRYTWQIVDGYSSAEILQELEARVAETGASELLFDCEGRACGKAVQWANRVFSQRVLYGREDLQQYRVYSLGLPAVSRLMMYSSARTADRQYLHVELLQALPDRAP